MARWLWVAGLVGVALGMFEEVRAQDAPSLVPPRLVSAPEVTLPEGSAPLEGDASAILTITIGTDGAVTDVVLETPLREDVDPLVLDAARQMRFEPATRDGTPIPATIRFRFTVAPPPTATATTTDTDAAAATGATAGADSTTAGTDSATPSANQASTPASSADTADTNIHTEPEPELEFGARAVVQRPEPGAATRITLQAEELTTVPGTFGEPLRVVATLPGVARTPFGGGFYVVRGAAFQNTGFYVDGFEVPILYHLFTGPAVISSRFVDKLDFYPGAFPTRYGRFAAGIISLDTAAPADRLHLEAEVDLFRASALGVVPFDGGKGTISAAYRRSYYELLLPLITDGVNVRYQDWQARLDYRFSSDVSASLFWFGSEDALDINVDAGAGVGDDQTNTSLNYQFQRLIGKLVWRLPESARLTWSGTAGVNKTGFARQAPGGTTFGLALDGAFFGQRLELGIPESADLETSLGVDLSATIYDARSTLPSPPGWGEYPPLIADSVAATEVLIEPIVMTLAPYVEQVARFGPLEVVGGLRVERLQYARVQTVQVDPRVVVRAKLMDELTLKAATGMFTQPPQPFQIAYRFGNPSLAPQRAWQSSAGFELELPLDLHVESQVFYNRFYQLPRSTNQLVIDERTGTPRRQVFEADGEGRSYGWEFLLRRKLADGFYGWISYTLAWSDRFVEGGATVPFAFDQRHNLYVALSYAWEGWRFGARFTLSTGRPDRPIVAVEEDVDSADFDSIRGGYTSRFPTFHQLDIRIDREFTIGDNIVGSVYLDILNVYNQPNTEGTLYQYDFQKSARLPGLPILPTLGVRLEYE